MSDLSTNGHYEKFLKSKRIRIQSVGKECNSSDIHPRLFEFQRDVTLWAIKKGRAAIFLDTGLGKTNCQLEWARLMGEKTIIFAPLSVARQTIREAKKINLDVKYVRSQSEVDSHSIVITNYEMLEHFDASQFGAVVLDESSILKCLDGVTRRKLTDMFAKTPYRLCCTATPAPNDQSEIGNHSEFLGIATIQEMLAMFFVHANKVEETAIGEHIIRKKQSGNKGQEWRLKYHARDAFYQWMSSWAISIKKPSDLGYSDDGYILPSLNVIPEFMESDYVPEGQLFFTELKGIQDRHAVRKSTVDLKIQRCAELVNSNRDQWIIWCGLNTESEAAHKAIPGSVNVTGSDSPELKAQAFEDFQDGKIRVLITKSKVGGFGMNFQNAHNMIFIGLNDSFESFYQCVRRCWRFGQSQPVNAYILLSEIEREIHTNVMQKEAVANRMTDELIKQIRGYEIEELKSMEHKTAEYREETIKGENFTAMLGDSSVRLKEIADSSIDLSVYSPPFADLYTYSDTERDLGNSKDWDTFFGHYAFIIQEILRVTKPGRLTCVHTADIPAMMTRDGYIGMKDFPGAVIRAYEKEGWIFHGRAIVPKNPQSSAIRTKARGLMFVQLNKDSSYSRPVINDQVLIFLKEGENKVPVLPVQNGEMTNETWIDWAGGIWGGIRESDTLSYTEGRDANDEKHICALQLGTIERCIKLYSNPGETVLTPFLGVGSEAYQAVRFGRKAIGIELKESYFNVAVKNLQNIEREVGEQMLV